MRCAPQRNLFELGLYGGIYLPPARHDLYDPATRPVKPMWAANPTFGLRAAYFPLRLLGVEIEGELTPARLRVQDDDPVLVWAVRGHAIVQSPVWRITPFALAGAGALGVRSPTFSLGRDVDPAVHMGLGLKAYVLARMAVRLEGRSLLSARAAEQTDTTAHWQVLLGVSLVLGRRAPPPPPPDRDRDGIADDRDQCPDEVGLAPTGCPRRDADGDGFFDDEDRCPAEAGVAPDGCPLRDRDGDGVLDRDDACPDEPETVNGFDDEDGCPDEIPEDVKEFSGVIDGIQFAFGSDAITPTSAAVLDRAAGVLSEYEQLQVEIVGHTDDVGDRQANLDLSARRAQAVKDYLVGKGIGAARLRTRGAGPDEPIEDNTTEAGRARNRRTEFIIRAGTGGGR